MCLITGLRLMDKILEVRKDRTAMTNDYEALEVVEIGKAEDVVLANGSSSELDNEIMLTRYP